MDQSNRAGYMIHFIIRTSVVIQLQALRIDSPCTSARVCWASLAVCVGALSWSSMLVRTSEKLMPF